MTAVSIERGSEPGGLAVAAEALASGSVVAVPTDTVYGLAVVPSVPGTVERLFSLKGRPKDVAIPVLVATWHDVGEVAGQLEGDAELLAVRYWPGPLTLVVPRADGYSVDLGGPAEARRTVGLRWPDHPVVGRLCRELGPLAVTSANLHGSPPASTAGEVAAAFSGLDGLGVVLDGGRCDGRPSTVVECRGPATRCLREGTILWDEIVKLTVGGPSPDGS
ncbi:MAG: L-threonylcarbamoyladenylate synthase [Acidimicrobiales bacterium]